MFQVHYRERNNNLPTIEIPIKLRTFVELTMDVASASPRRYFFEARILDIFYFILIMSILVHAFWIPVYLLVFHTEFYFSGYEFFRNSWTWKGKTSIFCLTWRKRWSVQIQPEGKKNCSGGKIENVVDALNCFLPLRM